MEHSQKYKEKPLHGQYIKATEAAMDQKSWEWLKKGYLKKETEGTILAGQDH